MSETIGVDEAVHDYDDEWFAQRGIDDERVIDALGVVPRRPFIIDDDARDGKLPSKVLPPMEVVGKLLTALELTGEETVLEVGTDTGYITAVLAELAETIYTVERRLQIAKLAEGRFEKLDVEGVEILYGPRLGEYALHAPYDAIVISAIAPQVPEKLKERLAVDGRLVVPVGDSEQNPEIICVRRVDEETWEETSLGQLRFSAKLGEILVELGVADRDDIELAALEADARGQRIGEALVEHSDVQESHLVRALAIQRGYKIASADQLLEFADHELAFSVPRAFLDHHRVVPLVIEGSKLKVATVDPDAPTVEVAQILDADSVETYLVTSDQFQRIWNAILEGRGRSHPDEDTLKGRVESKFETVLRVANRLGARTIHVDSEPDGGKVRFRVDEGLRTLPDLAFDATEVDYLIEFLKLGADLDVLEERVPQRGRFSWIREPGTYHLNVHVMPSVTGEQLSIQLLSDGARCPSLRQLGFSDELVDDLKVLLQRLSGLFLIVGPRHVTKRETLYALLGMLAADDTRKVGTIERDIQYTIDGVQQVVVQPDRDFGYRNAIREFVRFHFDVFGVDELTDPEVVTEAINAARRGPKVLAALHGHDAAHVISGLRDFGLSADVLTHGISAVLTQRMVPAICSGCRREIELDDPMVEALFDGETPQDFRAFRGVGCNQCDQTGVDGQLPLVELIPFGDAVRDAIVSEASSDVICDTIRQTGSETLGDHAMRLASEGKMPVDELGNWI